MCATRWTQSVLVVDASVVVPALAHGGDDGERARARLISDHPVAPELLDVEVVSALRGLVRGAKLPAEDAARALALLASMPITRASHGRLIARVWSLRDNLTAYDATYVALAESLEATLVTRDARIAAAPGLRCPVEVLP